jgi:hypothetical protein
MHEVVSDLTLIKEVILDLDAVLPGHQRTVHSTAWVSCAEHVDLGRRYWMFAVRFALPLRGV